MKKVANRAAPSTVPIQDIFGVRLFTSRIVGPLFPKERVPTSNPVTPREVGTTVTPIVAFPCVRTKFAGAEYFGLLQVGPYAPGLVLAALRSRGRIRDGVLDPDQRTQQKIRPMPGKASD